MLCSLPWEAALMTRVFVRCRHSPRSRFRRRTEKAAAESPWTFRTRSWPRRTASTPPFPAWRLLPPASGGGLRGRRDGGRGWGCPFGAAAQPVWVLARALQLQCFSVPSRAKGVTGGVPSVGCSSSLRLGSAALLSGSQAL